MIPSAQSAGAGPITNQVAKLLEKRDIDHMRMVLKAAHLLTALVLVAALVAGGDWLVVGVMVALCTIAFELATSRLLARMSEHRISNQQALAQEATEQRRQTQKLFGMTDMLQSAQSHEDAGEVLAATAGQLLPYLRGALYIFSHSQDRLDLACMWPRDETSNPVKTLVPDNCWALKRGKPHFNDPKGGSLCCKHNNGEYATIEVPMIARGTVHGLLMLATSASDGAQILRANARVVQALADSMSLALANIALQDKLRMQSLRDPLTGLYNRRYMEDALERYLSIAERNGSSTSVIMLDLDHFKHLNDTHGHAKGDAVLRDVATQLSAAVRPADIVARYGGEELLVIMPGCDIDDAVLKAEILRARVENLSELHGVPVSASFGVASVPATSSTMADLIPMADAALYAAKQAGRNCVQAARRRRESQPAAPARLAVG